VPAIGKQERKASLSGFIESAVTKETCGSPARTEHGRRGSRHPTQIFRASPNLPTWRRDLHQFAPLLFKN
jgi:hypothetical protein